MHSSSVYADLIYLDKLSVSVLTNEGIIGTTGLNYVYVYVLHVHDIFIAYEVNIS